MTPGMSVNDIKAELARRGLSQAGIAKKMGVDRSLVTLVLLRGQANVKIRRALAEAIEQPYIAVWGEADPEMVRPASEFRTPGVPQTDADLAMPPPPLGVPPRWLVDERRAVELVAAMQRQLEVGAGCNWRLLREWNQELGEIAKRQAARKPVLAVPS